MNFSPNLENKNVLERITSFGCLFQERSHSASIFVIHLNFSLPMSLLKSTCCCGSEVKRRSSFISPRPGASQQWTLPSPLLTTASKLQDYRDWVRRAGRKQQAPNFVLILPLPGYNALTACFKCLSIVKCVNIQIIVYIFILRDSLRKRATETF